MTSDEDNFYIKIIYLGEINNFIVLNFFVWGHLNACKNNMKFYKHNSRIIVLITLEKKNLSFMVSNKDTFFYQSYSSKWDL